MDQQSGFELGDWAWKALTGILGILGWNTLGRVQKLEGNTQTISQASLERSELREDIQELSDRMDRQHSSISGRLDGILDKLS